MKIIFNILRALAAVGALVVSPPAHAYVYFTRDALVTSFFPEQEVRTVTYAPDRDAFRAAVGYPPPRPSYEILVGSHGYAIIDEQLGQHEPITFAVLLDAAARVQRLEVMVYREAYGDGVRAPTFRDQFRGLGLEAPMRPGKDIRIVSGATISTRSLAVGTRRACAILSSWLASGAS